MLLQVTLWRGLAVLTKQVILLVETSPIHHNLGIRNVSFMAGCGGGGGGINEVYTQYMHPSSFFGTRAD